MKKVMHVKEFRPGSFSSSELIRCDVDVTSFSPQSKHTYAWQFGYFWETPSPDGQVCRSEFISTGPRYIYGKVFTQEEAKKAPWCTPTLISNMECNGWEKVILCDQGVIPFSENMRAMERP